MIECKGNYPASFIKNKLKSTASVGIFRLESILFATLLSNQIQSDSSLLRPLQSNFAHNYQSNIQPFTFRKKVTSFNFSLSPGKTNIFWYVHNLTGKINSLVYE